MKTRCFDHIDLRVKDLQVADRFYSQVLPAIGFTEKSTGDWISFEAEGEGKPEFFGFTADPEHRPNGTRISFWADTRAEVNRVAEIVKKAGGRVLEGPELCADYSANYYAFFFEDPEGNKLEICCRLPASE
ncbi:MAG: VOC family protein [Verrucomicrobiota bacterium]|nr:VOC family protein [Verrucomicrobiota bacterium]